MDVKVASIGVSYEVQDLSIKWGHYKFLSSLFMTKEFALDLKVAHQNSGLTQQDCAHLLGVSDATLAKIEVGKRTPSICEICTLSLIYGRSFESLFSGIFLDVRAHLSARMVSLPEPSGTAFLRINRQSTLSRLARRLAEELPDYETC